MKKLSYTIIASTIGIVLIPFIIMLIFNKEPKEILIDYGLISKKEVRILRNETGVIEKMPIEEYVVGVLAGEMPISFHIEALKAQAVAARSYVLKRIIYNENKEYDVIDTVQNQVYLDDEYLKNAWKDNYITNINKLRLAVKDTEGLYLMHDNDVIDAMFFSTSNGFTENSEDVYNFNLPYLRSVVSPWDKISSAFSDTVELSLEEFYNRLEIESQDNITFESISKTDTGRNKKVKINGITMDAMDTRMKLKIKSTDFFIEQKNNKIIIHTKGFGHGVGMSQYGALGMAEEGYSFYLILYHYYTGTKLKKF